MECDATSISSKVMMNGSKLFNFKKKCETLEPDRLHFHYMYWNDLIKPDSGMFLPCKWWFFFCFAVCWIPLDGTSTQRLMQGRHVIISIQFNRDFLLTKTHVKCGQSSRWCCMVACHSSSQHTVFNYGNGDGNMLKS